MHMQKQLSARLYLQATGHFIQSLTYANFRDVRGLVITLLTPLLLLFIFYVSGDPETLVMMVPMIIGLTVMFSGTRLATRVISWRNQDIFQRLAAAPVPMGYLMVGIVLSYMVNILLESLLVLLLSLVLVELSITIPGIGLTVLILILGATCFLSFGAMIANLVNRAETATSLYVFTLMPMIFLGGGMFDVPILSDIGVILPTTMLTSALNFIVTDVSFSDMLLYSGGLLMYTVIFSAIAAYYFDWE